MFMVERSLSTREIGPCVGEAIVGVQALVIAQKEEERIGGARPWSEFSKPGELEKAARSLMEWCSGYRTGLVPPPDVIARVAQLRTSR